MNIRGYITEKFENITIHEISPSKIEFEERVKLKCFFCNRYNQKWTCPPKIPKVDYEQIIKKEYSEAIILEYKLKVNDDNFEEIRTKTTNYLHKTMLDLEKYLYKNNCSIATSFIGGSCKLCKNCNPEHCNNPLLARIPMEATGINVLKTMKNIGVEIKFPITDSLSRFGLLLWEEE